MPPQVGEGGGKLVGVLVAGFIGGIDAVGAGAGEELDGSAHGEVAEDAGGGSPGDFDAVEFGGRETVPIHPTAEGVVFGDAVPKQQRAAGA